MNGSGTSNNLFVFVILIPIIMLFFFLNKKNKNKKQEGLDKDNSRGDEVSRTIREFLRSEKTKGLEIISSYSIRRPTAKEMHKRLKEAALYQAKLDAKKQKIRYRKPDIPKKFPLEDYFVNLYKETYEISKPFRLQQNFNQRSNVSFSKPHRAELIQKNKNKFKLSNLFKLIKKKKNIKDDQIPNDREIYVLIFRTKVVQTKEINDLRAIEVEVLKKTAGAKQIERQIIINKEVDLEKEMAWIAPIKDREEKEAAEEAEKVKKLKIKQQKKYQLWSKNQLWYQKITPKRILPFINKLTKKTPAK